MKKIFTTICMVMSIYSLSQAQTKGSNEFSFSLGLSSSYLSSDGQNVPSSDFIWKPNAAVTFEHYLSDSWALKTKAIYDQKGAGNSLFQKGTAVVTGVYYPINYVTVPITAAYHFGNENSWYFSGGPYIGFLLSASESYSNSDLKSNYKSTDAGAALGVGIRFPLAAKSTLFIEWDGQFGFTNIANGANGATTADGATTARLSINVGVAFK
jgi:hypothetical protein